VVERKISHFSRRPLGRSQGSLPLICPHIDGHPDPGSVIHLARPDTLGLHQGTNGWAMA